MSGPTALRHWDLRGKIENQPCWRLLGGAAHDRITPYASLLPEGDNIAEYTKSLVERTIAARDLGFKAAKLEVLIKGPFTHHSISVDDDDEIVRIVAASAMAIAPMAQMPKPRRPVINDPA